MVKRTERLQGSKNRRDDEYYTLYDDIAAEVRHYLPQLRGKRILCPCDWDEVDHKTPWSLGGRTVLSNAQLLCSACIRKQQIKIIKHRIKLMSF